MRKEKKESMSIKLSGKQLTLLISAIFLISIVSFLFGVFIIKGTSPNKQPVLPSKSKKQPAKTPPKQTSSFKKENLTFFNNLSSKNNAAKQMLLNRRPVPPPAKKIKKLPVAKKEKGSYTIQLVSYRKKEYAEKLQKILSSRGYQAYITKADIPKKGLFYRVRIGSFSDKQSANKIAEDIYQKEATSLKFGKPIVLKQQ